MATTLTFIAPPLKRLPLIAPIGEPDIWWTPYPKAEIVYNIQDGAITVAGAGEDQALVISCALPTSFAYVLQDLTMTIKAAGDIDDWRLAALAKLKDATAAAWELDMVFEGSSLMGSAAAQLRTYGLRTEPPQKMLLATGGGATLTITLDNPVIDGEAAEVDFFARFLQFDLNQGFRTSVNTPILTR